MIEAQLKAGETAFTSAGKHGPVIFSFPTDDPCRYTSVHIWCRPVAGEGAGGALLQKWNFSTKMDNCQWKLKFQSIVDHGKIMHSCSSVQFGIV